MFSLCVIINNQRACINRKIKKSHSRVDIKRGTVHPGINYSRRELYKTRIIQIKLLHGSLLLFRTSCHATLFAIRASRHFKVRYISIYHIITIARFSVMSHLVLNNLRTIEAKFYHLWFALNVVSCSHNTWHSFKVWLLIESFCALG